MIGRPACVCIKCLGEEIEEEELEGAEEQVVEKEQEFNLKEFLMSFSSPRVLQVYALVLNGYKTNDVHTNHCTVKMLHRVALQVRDVFV